MIILADTKDIVEVERECNGYAVEELITPISRRRLQRPERHFAVDNGAFAKFVPRHFRSLLTRLLPHRDKCRFVAVPDVVGDARRTAEMFDLWKGELSEWPLAFVCQDGQENIPIPWDDIAAIFIGGTNRFKESASAVACIKAAQIAERWVHVGRVNTPGRFTFFEQLGVNSCDGSGIARYSHMREKMTHDPPLFSRRDLCRLGDGDA